MDEPLVSVLMSVYNEEDYLEETMESVFNQTYPNYEVIIVDDGSTDKTPQILETYEDKETVSVITQENTGLTKALNNGLTHCEGKYIARQDADEVSIPERIESQVQFLESHPKHALVGGWRKDVYENGEHMLRKFPTEDESLRQSLVRTCTISHSCVMVRTDVMKAKEYDEYFKTSQDYDAWVRIAAEYKIANLPKKLTKAYIRKGSITRQKPTVEAIKYAMKIRWKAYKSLECPWWYFIHIPKPILVEMLPERVIRYILRRRDG